MAEWKIKVKDEDSEESEDFETEEESKEEEINEETESSEEPEALEDILQNAPSRTNFRFNRQGVSLSLEPEPVEDLEQGLRQVPAQAKDNEKDKGTEQPILYNAPQYSSNYEKGDYENMKNVDKEIDISGGALTTRDTAMHFAEQRRMDLNAWQQQNMERFEAQGEKYHVGKTERLEQEGNLPFQDTKKPKRF